MRVSKIYYLYYFLTFLLSPFVCLIIALRAAKGKEVPVRWREKLGRYKLRRPEGELLWIHCASVGEFISIINLISMLKESYNILITSATKSSVEIFAKKAPPGILHQFAPLDSPLFVRRFFEHWKPDIGVFVDSEFWPNTLHFARLNCKKMYSVNTRVSEKSLRLWLKVPHLFRDVFKHFDLIFPYSFELGKILKSLGVKNVMFLGNIKYDMPATAFDSAQFEAFKQSCSGRKIIVFASTHKGEEVKVLRAFKSVMRQFPKVMGVLVPRHPARATSVEEQVRDAGLKYAVRSRGEVVSDEISLYIADTLGELMGFYSIADVVFIGGTLIPDVGGHNPLEAAYFSKPIIMGDCIYNFKEIVKELEAERGILLVDDETFERALFSCLKSPERAEEYGRNAKRVMQKYGSIAQKIAEYIRL